ncbi:putative late blight resistance protein homolog R1A-4 [Sesamum indicum]|uniref:Late blight resistance protein homolog R1A-4 n=1 Tax=Sesamum indicum TaxID=4182 RepID=A0A6I9U033_SESIN|nr:putative late blight resistance protein homolog R1A-4 [Sesamum indicum]
MAYATLISLKQTIERLLNSSQNPNLPPCPKTIEFAYEEVKSLQELFTSEDNNSKRVNAWERQIIEAAFRLEDVLESAHVSNLLLPQSEILHGDEISYSAEVNEEIEFFTETVKKIKDQISNSSLPEKDDAVVFCTTDHVGGKKSRMLGLDNELSQLKDLLVRDESPSLVIPIVGMAGVGKTTLANEVYGDPDIVSHFERRIFVSLGPECAWRKILLSVLAQINSGIDETHVESNAELAVRMYNSLWGWQYLIVLDDMWDNMVWAVFRRYLPDNGNGSRIMLTTRLLQIARYAVNNDGGFILQKRFLNEEESWHLLREKVLTKEWLLPPEFEKAGRKIAKKCEGLPLAIIAVAKHLSQAEKTLEYWKKVAKEVHSVVGADQELSKVLYWSYYYLPQCLKPCFVYMGVFPHDYEISTSKLINLWCAEGFLERNPPQTLEDFARECLEELVWSNVFQVRTHNSFGGFKTCNIYFVFWHICVREAEKDKFFHIVNSYGNQGIESQRRLCIHNNVLFSIKDVHNSMASILNARSLLCTGPHHQYPVPICLGFRLLRVLDALTVRFYGFPIEIVKLVQLRYLAFTYNGRLPASISKLQNLRHLIVHQYLSIISSRARRSYLPMEIWNMRELKHLQVMGSDLPNPDSEGAFLPNLSTLLGISAHSCTEEILGRIPNLKKLGFQVELPLDAVEPLHVANSRGLKSLKCAIVNPNPSFDQVVVPALQGVSIFPSTLKKLTLSGLSLPWEDMSIIACIWNLEVLKLRCYAFRGSVWQTCQKGFKNLRFLLIEDMDLEYWTGNRISFFPDLQRLTVGHCYKLKEIPCQFEEVLTLQMMEVVDCAPSLVASAEKIVKQQKGCGNHVLQLRVKSSKDARKALK